MALALREDQEYLGKERWKWSVWVEGSSEELDAIDHVVYVLHSSFEEPVRVVNDRPNKFRLNATGWGNFTIHAKAVKKGEDCKETPISLALVLRYPDGTQTFA